MSDTRPNVLLITTDQQRYNTIAALGHPLLKTPTLDRLANEGVAFTRCYTPSPVCAPARAALASGLPPHVSGIVDNNRSWDRPRRSIMEALRDDGYQTQGVGKMHFMPDPYLPWGFEHRDTSEEGATDPHKDNYVAYLQQHGYDHLTDYLGPRSEFYYMPQVSQVAPQHTHTAWTADRSIDFFNDRDTDKPFFLWSSFIRPHPPFENPPPWHMLYRPRQMDDAFVPDNADDLLTYWNRAQNRYKHRDGGADRQLVHAIRAAYYAAISYIDFHLGRMLDALGDQLSNTLVLFTSDHGELLGDYGSFGKRTMLDVAARVPMLARLPGTFDGGARCETPCSLIDLYPTITQAAGQTTLPPYPHAMSLQQVLAEPDPDRLVTSTFRDGPTGLFMGATATAKYIYASSDRKAFGLNLERDPKESVNVPDDPAVQKVRARLIDRLRDDGFTDPFDGDGWKTYPQPTFPTDPDDGLLQQDHPHLQEKIDALGQGYARQVSLPNEVTNKLLLAKVE